MWKQDVPMTKTPYFSIAPPLQFLSYSFLSLCMYSMSVCYACEGSVTACFPLSYHSCSTHPLHPVGLPANEGESQREKITKVRKEMKKQEKRIGEGLERTDVKL